MLLMYLWTVYCQKAGNICCALSKIMSHFEDDAKMKPVPLKWYTRLLFSVFEERTSFRSISRSSRQFPLAYRHTICI